VINWITRRSINLSVWNESVPKIIINDAVISNHDSFRVLFDKIAFVYFISKMYIYFSHWKWPAQGTSTVPIVSAHFCSLSMNQSVNVSAGASMRRVCRWLVELTCRRSSHQRSTQHRRGRSQPQPYPANHHCPVLQHSQWSGVRFTEYLTIYHKGYLKFIVRPTYDSDLRRPKSSFKNIVRKLQTQ